MNSISRTSAIGFPIENFALTCDARQSPAVLILSADAELPNNLANDSALNTRVLA
jgi:hypothetical protein